MKRNPWQLPALVAALVALAPAVHPSVAKAELSTGANLSPAAATSTEAWAPVRALIGKWSGVKSAPAVPAGAASLASAKPTKVSRKFETGIASKHLELSEKNGDAPWGVAGVISFDADRGGLVLRHFGTDGKTTDLAYDAAESGETKLVFAGIADNPGRTRVTYERASWNELTERIEYAPQGGSYVVVSETKLKRKG
jgi:hypothetical protein